MNREEKIDRILDLIGPLQMDTLDFVELALSCLDQAGLPVAAQNVVDVYVSQHLPEEQP